jgi:hypothetical protein
MHELNVKVKILKLLLLCSRSNNNTLPGLDL